MLQAFASRDAAGWNNASASFADTLREDLGKAGYPSQGNLQREIQYNRLRPFRVAWIAYLTAFISLLFFGVSKARPFQIIGSLAMVVAVGIHAYGFVLRCLIAGRPPVTNMYESIIWVTFGCVFFSLLIAAVYRNWVIPTAASAFAIVGLVLADTLPNVLDPSINPLEPVLRSNYWLTIHVLTITLSYAAFALSLCLGNVVLGTYVFSPANSQRIQQNSLYMYRAMQIGIGITSGRHHFGRRMGRLLVGQILGMGSERGLGAHRTSPLSRRASRTIHRLVARVWVCRQHSGVFPRRLDGLVRCELCIGSRPALLRLRHWRNRLGPQLHWAPTRVHRASLRALRQHPPNAAARGNGDFPALMNLDEPKTAKVSDHLEKLRGITVSKSP